MKNYVPIRRIPEGYWTHRDSYMIYRSYDGIYYHISTLRQGILDLKQLNLYNINGKINIDCYPKPKIVGDLPHKKSFLRRIYEIIFSI